jgi:MFS family permease
MTKTDRLRLAINNTNSMEAKLQTPIAPNPASDTRWWKLLDGTQKYVFVMASLAWLFDCLGQQVFVIARAPAIHALMPPGTPLDRSQAWGAYTMTIFVLGWASGGLIFGAIGDRIGRARSLAITILLYGLCTGLSGFSTNLTDFCVYRFITGLGVGGVFGLAVALCADSLPDRARPHALGMLQALSALGNIGGGLIAMFLGYRMIHHPEASGWRSLFILGAVPPLICVLFQFRMKEPEKWVAARAQGKIDGARFGSYTSLLGEARWRKPALFGMVLCVAGVVGLWGIGNFSPTVTNFVIGNDLAAANTPASELPGRMLRWVGGTMILQQIGAFFGMLTFTSLAHHYGRKKVFALAAVCAMVSTMVSFKFLTQTWELFVFLPIMGFFQLALFAGFAIYLPELFPLRLRSTGVGFCYNVGRFIAASGPLTLGVLQLQLARNAVSPEAKMEAFRNAACWVSLIYLLALCALPFLPETKGHPLPEG